MIRWGALLVAGSMVIGTGVVRAAEGDVTFERQGEPSSEYAPAVFPHWVHRIRYRCYACHDALFPMRAGEHPVTMDDIMAGRSCGACHNGRTAWPVTFETCQRCHQAR
jgi:c(7)-type cytochrome triheme protein